MECKDNVAIVEDPDSEVKLHPIFTKDPGELMHFVHKEVCVTTEDGKSHTGRVYTIDPVSQSVVLVRFDSTNQTIEDIKVVMGHCVQEMVIKDDDTEKYKSTLDALFKPQSSLTMSPEELGQRKEKMKQWLLKNRIPIEEPATNTGVLTLSNALTIEPPYTAENCRSTNETILGRIQAIIRNMPDDFDG